MSHTHTQIEDGERRTRNEKKKKQRKGVEVNDKSHSKREKKPRD